ALEGAVLDLQQVVGEPAVGVRALALTGDEEGALVDDDVHVRRVDPGQIDGHAQLGRLLGAHEVDVRPEPSARRGEPRPVPELREDVLELGMKTPYVVTG